jgi:hypothetical protein
MRKPSKPNPSKSAERKGAGPSRKNSRQLRRAELREEARAVLGKIGGFLGRSRVTYPDGPPLRYLEALLDIAESEAVRHKTAWLIEQEDRFAPQDLSRPQKLSGPEHIILGFMHLAALNVTDNRVAMKPHEVKERRDKLLEFGLASRAEATAAADLGDQEQALELEERAMTFETWANSLYREDDPAMVAYRMVTKTARRR